MKLLQIVRSECARHSGDSHMLETTCPQSSVKLSQFQQRMCTALRREPFVGNDPPCICEIAAGLKLQAHGW
eukprot:7396883-Pyramimonas_sp.AAC.1